MAHDTDSHTREHKRGRQDLVLVDRLREDSTFETAGFEVAWISTGM